MSYEVTCLVVLTMHRSTVVGRSLSSQNLGTKDSGLCIEAWKGIYPSIRPTQNGLSVTVGKIPLYF